MSVTNADTIYKAISGFLPAEYVHYHKGNNAVVIYPINVMQWKLTEVIVVENTGNTIFIERKKPGFNPARDDGLYDLISQHKSEYSAR